MSNSGYNTVDFETGNIVYKGQLEVVKGNHKNMASRTEAYLPGDERGHINASSLNGSNNRLNIVPQHKDVNHGAYYSMEKGETNALKNEATIDSEKSAIVDSKPGDRPNTFIVNDDITYMDGHKEAVHHSFINESYAEQTAWNDISATLPGAFDAENPGDGLRDSMSNMDYAELMTFTDAELPNIASEYEACDFTTINESVDEVTDIAVEESDITASDEISSSVSTDCDIDMGADAELE